MSDASRELVRCFFESQGFLVTGKEPLYVVNSRPAGAEKGRGFVLQKGTVGGIRRAVVNVRTWHTHQFFPSEISAAPHFFDFVRPKQVEKARKFFQSSDFCRVLVLSRLPSGQETRKRALQMIRKRGIDHVVEFFAVLDGIVGSVRADRSYTDNDLLETIRLLKSYKFIKEAQLAFF